MWQVKGVLAESQERDGLFQICLGDVQESRGKKWDDVEIVPAT